MYITNKKNVQHLENIYDCIKIWTFNYEKWGLFFLRNFFFFGGALGLGPTCLGLEPAVIEINRSFEEIDHFIYAELQALIVK